MFVANLKKGDAIAVEHAGETFYLTVDHLTENRVRLLFNGPPEFLLLLAPVARQREIHCSIAAGATVAELRAARDAAGNRVGNRVQNDPPRGFNSDSVLQNKAK